MIRISLLFLAFSCVFFISGAGWSQSDSPGKSLSKADNEFIMLIGSENAEGAGHAEKDSELTTLELEASSNIPFISREGIGFIFCIICTIIMVLMSLPYLRNTETNTE